MNEHLAAACPEFLKHTFPGKDGVHICCLKFDGRQVLECIVRLMDVVMNGRKVGNLFQLISVMAFLFPKSEKDDDKELD